MEMFVNNWCFLVVIISFVTLTILYVKKFSNLPTGQQKEQIKQWMLWAVSEAEKKYKTGTGTIKLRYVYDLFVKAFPTMAPLISFATFACWVDEVLEQMRHLMETNKCVQDYIEG